MEETGGARTGMWKLFAVPFIVAMLCAASLVGIGYSYSSSVSSSGTVESNAEILRISDGVSDTKVAEFTVCYYSTIVNGVTVWAIDDAPGRSILESTFTLTLDSNTGESKTVTLTYGEISLGSVTLLPYTVVIDNNGNIIGSAEGESTCTFTMSPELDGSTYTQSVTVYLGVSPTTMTPDTSVLTSTFTITAFTSD